MKIRYLVAFALILIAWTFVCEWYHKKHDKAEIKTDSVEVVRWKTVHDTLPVVRTETVVKQIKVPVPAVNRDSVATDSVAPDSVTLEIVQKEYTDNSTYTAYVSGAKIGIYPRLDSISVRHKIVERTITNTVYREKSGLRLKPRPALGGGYDPVNKQWGVYVGGAVVLDW